MFKQFYIFRNVKDNLLRFIEVKCSRISNWAWDQRWKHRDKDEWIKGYREWRKK
jgi:hypothetical protein